MKITEMSLTTPIIGAFKTAMGSLKYILLFLFAVGGIIAIAWTIKNVREYLRERAAIKQHVAELAQMEAANELE